MDRRVTMERKGNGQSYSTHLPDLVQGTAHMTRPSKPGSKNLILSITYATNTASIQSKEYAQVTAECFCLSGVAGSTSFILPRDGFGATYKRSSRGREAN